MPSSLSPSLRRLSIALLAVGVGLAIVAIAAYFVTFGPKSGFSLSPSDGAWSNFGSYLGGVLGPVFSFLAFSGVLLTVWLQAQQLDVSRTQVNLEEIQRVLSIVSTRIDELLVQVPSERVGHPKLREMPVTVFKVVAAAGTAALSPSDDYIVQASHEKLIAEAKIVTESQTTAIGIELEQLAWCLQQYSRFGGSETVAEFYKRRYGAIVCWLDAIGLISSHSRLQAYFLPKDFRKYLVP